MTAPVRLGEHVYALPIEATLMGGPTVIYPAVILDDTHGATLVDTGIPGMEDDIARSLAELGSVVDGRAARDRDASRPRPHRITDCP